MKIKSENEVFIIPASNGVHLLADNEYNHIIIDYLNSYFGQKKKTKCIVLDDEDDPIDVKTTNFIYFPSTLDLSNLFNLKAKTEINTELSEMIIQNSELFLSVDKLRSVIKDLLTDIGMYRFMKVLETDLDINVIIDTMNFDISLFLQLLRINNYNLSKEEQLMMLYNLMLYVNRDCFKILYIDFNVDDKGYQWMRNKNNDNHLILVNNENVTTPVNMIFNSIMLINNSNSYEKQTLNSNDIDLISYLFHPIVRKNKDKQAEKNLNFLMELEHINDSFFLEFTDPNH